MKTILITLSLVLSATAFAMPKIGDKATYAATSGIYAYTAELEIMSQAADGMFTVNQTTIYAGQKQVQPIQVAPSDLPSEALISSYLTNCALAGGKLETVTVPAGTFNTCAILNNGALVWLGSVPFGIVKSDGKAADGTREYMELQSYNIAK